MDTSASGAGQASPVVIIGGGITGLSAAWELQSRGVPYTLLEASGRLGGKVESLRTEDGFLVERAADAFILGKPYAAGLAREVGLETEVIHPRDDTKRLYFLRGGELIDFPQPLKMFVPLEDEPFRASGVLSPEGTERFLAEADVPPKVDDGQDESLASFVTRRFGEEALNFVVPMAAGIYVADPNELSMQAAFPQFLKMEQDHGSLIRGSRATPKASGPIFMSFRGGTEALVRAVAEHLTGDVRLNTPVAQVEPGRVTLEDGTALPASGVIVTVPARHAAPLLARSAPDAAAQIAALRANGSVAVTLAYRAGQLTFDMNMHGFLVDPSEGLNLTAMTVHSAKLHGRAPEGQVLVRCFFKGLDPDAALAQALAETARLLGASGEPRGHWIADWRGQNPAYQVGHPAQVARIMAALPPGVRVAGASYTGVGIPDCVNAGRSAARAVAAGLSSGLTV